MQISLRDGIYIGVYEERNTMKKMEDLLSFKDSFTEEF